MQPTAFLEVTPEEEGMKLLRFLERRLAGAPLKALLHKWIRTGQVRLNGGRTQPFALLASGDKVRIPPFAETHALCPAKRNNAAGEVFLGPDLPVLAADPELMVLNKPGGLPSQPGSKQEDSVSKRLARAFAGAAYIPAPAHRLDKHSSGLLLAAKTHAAQRRLHAFFAQGHVRKEYLAWVKGRWPYTEARVLEDFLVTERSSSGQEKVAALPGGRSLRVSAPPTETPPPSGSCPTAGKKIRNGVFARCIVLPLQELRGEERPLPFAGATLLLVLLLTGRKHQIRVQLSSRGFPLIGDGRYQGTNFSQMLLHAYALSLPLSDKSQSAPAPAATGAATAQTMREYTAEPPWSGAFAPEKSLLAAGRAKLAEAEQTYNQTRIPCDFFQIP